MRVLVNTLTTMQHKTGIGHYVAELVRALEQAEPGCVRTFPTRADRLMLRLWQGQSRLYERSARSPGVLSLLRKKARGKVMALWRKSPLAPPTERLRSVTRAGADLYHEPNLIPMDCEGPVVVTVRDLTALTNPEWHLPVWARHIEKHFLRGLPRCRHLIAPSEFGKRQIVEKLSWPEDRVTVTPPGVRPGLRRLWGDDLEIRLHVLGMKPGYFLHVGTIEPRKNLPMLLRAYLSLPADVRERAPLVLAGAPGWGSDELQDYLAGPARDDGVTWMSYIDDAHVATVYSGARALLVPSLHEGFGMPALEMLACAGTVIASSAGALPETTDGRALLLDPDDEAAWRAAMLRAVEDRDWRHAVREGALEVAARHTWARCAALTLTAYRRTLSG